MDGFDRSVYSQTYCKTHDGIIILKFSLRKRTGYIEKNDVIAVLPDGYRPSRNIPAVIGVDGIDVGTGIFSAEVQVSTSGQIFVYHINDKAKWVFGTLSFTTS